MPFSMIEVKFGIVGLCIPGVGEMKYDRMGQALAKILYGHLIPHHIDKIGRLDQLLLNAKNNIPPNGYEMLHILLELYVDPFKPHMVDTKWPTFGSCRNIFDYAGQFNVIMQLYEKKGDKVEPRKAAIKFLEAVKREGNVTYRAAALLLKTAIMERPSNAPLPARFEIGNMANFIADSNADASDDEYEMAHKYSTKMLHAAKMSMQGPQDQKACNKNYETHDIQTEISHSVITDTTKKASLSTITSELNPFIQGYTTHRHRINQTFQNLRDTTRPTTRPTPEPQRGRSNPRRRRAYDPFIKCHACGRTGHAATQCDTLAMAILIRKYMRESGNAEAMKQTAENWFRRNEEALKCPNSEVASHAKPLQVLHTYMDRYLKGIDEIDDQIDWEHFKDDEDVEEAMNQE